MLPNARPPRGEAAGAPAAAEALKVGFDGVAAVVGVAAAPGLKRPPVGVVVAAEAGVAVAVVEAEEPNLKAPPNFGAAADVPSSASVTVASVASTGLAPNERVGLGAAPEAGAAKEGTFAAPGTLNKGLSAAGADVVVEVVPSAAGAVGVEVGGLKPRGLKAGLASVDASSVFLSSTLRREADAEEAAAEACAILRALACFSFSSCCFCLISLSSFR